MKFPMIIGPCGITVCERWFSFETWDKASEHIGARIEKLKQEAAAHAEEDAKKRLLIEARNHAEQLVYTAEKSLKDAEKEVRARTKGKRRSDGVIFQRYS